MWESTFAAGLGGQDGQEVLGQFPMHRLPPAPHLLKPEKDMTEATLLSGLCSFFPLLLPCFSRASIFPI